MNFRELLFIFSLAALTTGAACVLTHRVLPLNSISVMEAVRALVDWAGAFTVFFAANLALGAVVILLIRALTARFIALYALGDFLLVIVSAGQAFVFQMWWRRN
jgi:hypothetical protein